MIKEVIEKLNNGIQPDKTELLETFDEIYTGVADEILSVSFITLITNLINNSEDSEIITNSVESANNAINRIKTGIELNFILQTGQNTETDKYLNVTFARDIILAANDIPVIKYEFDNPFEENNYIRLLREFKIPPLRKNIKGVFETENLEKENYCCFLLDETENYLKYTSNILSRLSFNNVLNITNKLLNPAKAKNIIFGTCKKNEVEKTAKILLQLGYINSLVISSGNNTPVISPENESYIAEAWKNKIFTYKFSPELLGFNKHEEKDIEFKNINDSLEKITELFKNKTRDAFYDTVVINSAIGLYIVKKAKSIIEGIELSEKIIQNNIALEKLTSLIK